MDAPATLSSARFSGTWGYIKGDVAETTQAVRGVIFALEDDIRLQRALSVAPSIDFYRSMVNSQLFRAPI